MGFQPQSGLWALHNKSERRPDTQSALANRQFGTSFCTILSNQSCRKVIDKADCRRMFQIGDRRMLVAYFLTEFSANAALRGEESEEAVFDARRTVPAGNAKLGAGRYPPRGVVRWLLLFAHR